jgi:hypothetical protein
VFKLSIRVMFVFCALFTCAVVKADSLTIGTWSEFSWGGVGQASPSFTYSSATPTLLRVVDCCVIGDQFSIYVNGVFALTTSDPSAWDDQDGGFEDSAWTDPRMSKGSILLPAGAYTVDEYVIRAATGYAEGSASIRYDASAIPEPASMALVAIGAAALCFMRRRRSA